MFCDPISWGTKVRKVTSFRTGFIFFFPGYPSTVKMVPQLLAAVFCTVLTVANGEDYRLPETIWPSKYEVDLLIPDTVFTGETNIFEGMLIFLLWG